MTVKGIKRRIAFFLVNNIFCGTHSYTFPIKRILLNWCGIYIGRGTKVVGPLRIYGELEVGENCWIGTDLKIYGNGKVTIANNCDIAPSVTFLTGTHEIGDYTRRAGKGKNGNIHIGDAVWIGGNSTIISDIIIKRSSVIGACSLVNKDIPSNVCVGGVPAKIIKNLDEK